MKNFESRFEHGENVAINFGYAGSFGECKVTGVHFTTNKVKYDVEILLENGDDVIGRTLHKTRLYNIDSDFVISRQEWLDLNQSKALGVQKGEKIEFYAVSAVLEFANWILGEFNSEYEGHVEVEHLESWKKKFNK